MLTSPHPLTPTQSYIYIPYSAKYICSVQSENLRNLEIALRILRIPLNKGMKDKITVTGDDLCNLLRSLTRERNRRRAARLCLDCTSPFRPIELSTCSAWGTWYASTYLVAWITTTVQPYQGCLPSCKLHSRSLTVRLTGKVRSSGLQAKFERSPRNLEIGAQSRDSENAQRNLEIAQILRLRGTYTLYCPLDIEDTV